MCLRYRDDLVCEARKTKDSTGFTGSGMEHVNHKLLIFKCNIGLEGVFSDNVFLAIIYILIILIILALIGAIYKCVC